MERVGEELSNFSPSNPLCSYVFCIKMNQIVEAEVLCCACHWCGSCITFWLNVKLCPCLVGEGGWCPLLITVEFVFLNSSLCVMNFLLTIDCQKWLQYFLSISLFSGNNMVKKIRGVLVMRLKLLSSTAPDDALVGRLEDSHLLCYRWMSTSLHDIRNRSQTLPSKNYILVSTVDSFSQLCSLFKTAITTEQYDRLHISENVTYSD